ncbi:Probable steroid-binding protein 3 [Linum perenne]
MAIEGRMFDVIINNSFYAPDGSYSMFADKDAIRALAKMSNDDADIVPSLQGLAEKEMGVLADWEKKFEAKYHVSAVSPKLITS